jgi:para-aminobenzoate synthetase/4-amino-4-deoxychorismate lyase
MTEDAHLAYAPFPARYYPILMREPGAILLQTSRFSEDDHRSYLFFAPDRVLSATTLDEIPALFDDIEQALQTGAYVAGFMSYECGAHFQEIAGAKSANTGLPLASFGVYPRAYVFDHRAGTFEGSAPDESHVSPTRSADRPERGAPKGFEVLGARLEIASEEYAAKIELIKEYIRSGDTYQVNFTDKFLFEFEGSPLAMFAAANERQHVSYSAFLNLPDCQILSFSPELFFRVRDGRIFTRPMKGTARRGRYLSEDDAICQWLQHDLKNRSENVMIVDLLRNDLGRVCEFGSVETQELFTVEKYETLFQMTSSVSGVLRPGISYYEIFRSLFPCGSVTGAPKIRTMEIIGELERGLRGVYTGAIGFFSPKGEAVFNVPIRTVVLQGARGEMGVGSGIVIDSIAEDEYRECLLKAEFLAGSEQPFQLIESILWDGGYPLQPLHLERLQSSAEYFGFGFDLDATFALLEVNQKSLDRGTAYKVRLLLDKSGALSIENLALEKQEATGRVGVSSSRTSSDDRFLYHKTTRRELYDESYRQARQNGCDDVLFLNERDEVTEGAISNVFIETGGRLFTPPVICGLLPGVYRRHILETNACATEKVLSRKDLEAADAIYLCNAVRGLRKVTIL